MKAQIQTHSLKSSSLDAMFVVKSLSSVSCVMKVKLYKQLYLPCTCLCLLDRVLVFLLYIIFVYVDNSTITKELKIRNHEPH